MDGNGRWAKRRHLPRIAGHRRGVESVRKVVTDGFEHRLVRNHAVCVFGGKLYPPPADGNPLPDEAAAPIFEERAAADAAQQYPAAFIGRSHMLPQEVQERMAWAKEQTHTTPAWS